MKKTKFFKKKLKNNSQAKITNLYTRTGDRGMSSLLKGRRLAKDNIFFSILGSLDELNSFIGWAKVLVKTTTINNELTSIQDKLLTLGAIIAKSKVAKINQKDVIFLESRIDYYQKYLNQSKKWSNKFLFPGGTELAARLDLSRTNCRKLERRIVKFNKTQIKNKLSPIVLSYLNRLSDYLFALRCFINLKKKYKEKKYTVK